LIVVSEGPRPRGSGLSRDQAALLGLGVSFRDRPDAELEPLRHVALGQQPHSGLDFARVDIGLQRQHESEIAWALDRSQRRYPVGHLSFSVARIGKACHSQFLTSTIFELLQCPIRALTVLLKLSGTADGR